MLLCENEPMAYLWHRQRPQEIGRLGSQQGPGWPTRARILLLLLPFKRHPLGHLDYVCYNLIGRQWPRNTASIKFSIHHF